MNTKLVMTLSAAALGLAGILLTFAPAEIARAAGLGPELQPATVLLLQLVGALYLGFALLNWMAKGAHIGGIYNRPIATANLTHFLVMALALLKGCTGQTALPPLMWGVAAAYSVFALLFGIILFRHPLPADQPR
jgi:Na+-driven multidrug efflux pump